METLNYSGIKIFINRKKIKNLYLRIDPFNGKVQISAPYFVSDKIIMDFVKRKSEWIKKKLRKIESKRIELKNNETIELFGKKLKLTITESKKPDILITDGNILFYFPTHYNIEKKVEFFEIWQKGKLKEIADKLIKKWENRTGINISEVKIRKMKSKWGSCNIKSRKITLNLALIKKPVICLEYVIVHEFVHFYERYHNKNFYNKLAKLFPNWKTAENLLK